MERLRSSSPLSPTPLGHSQGNSMAPQNPKRHYSEAPQVSRSAPKKRRLVSIGADDLRSSTRSSQGTNQPLRPSLIPRPVQDEATEPLDDLAGLQFDASSPVIDPLPPAPQLSISYKTPVAAPAAIPRPNGSAKVPGVIAQKVISLGSQLIASPPQSTAAGPEAAEAAAQVAQLQAEYKTIEAKLHLARNRLTEQLNVFEGPGRLSTSTTPASLRPGSTMPISIHVNEDDAVASALSHINSLESRRTGLLSRIHAAQAAELEARQQRDSRQLTVQVENARIFRRVVDLGPTGVACLLRALLESAGIPTTPNTRELEDLEVMNRKAYVQQELEDDLAREGLIHTPIETPPLEENGSS